MGGFFLKRGVQSILARFSAFADNSKEKKQRPIIRVAGAAESLGLDEEHVAEDISALKGEKHKRTVDPSEIKTGEEEKAVISGKV